MQWVVIGQFGKPHGLKGLVSIHSFTRPQERLLQYSNWHMQTLDGWTKIDVQKVQLQGRALLAKIAGVQDRDQAAALTNRQIAVPEDALPALEEGEYYWFHLLGLQVVNQKGIVLGKVEDLMATGSNDVLIVKGEKERLIPYLPEQFILKVDKSRGIIVVDWDENF